MEMAPVVFIEDCAKYPFLKQASAQIQQLELTIQNIAEPENALVLERAEKRLENAIFEGHVGGMVKDKRTEISSFAVAVILAIATKNSLIKKRYALAEAKTAYAKMLNEPKDKIMAIAKDFSWNLNSGKPYKDFSLGFNFYLQNAAHLHGIDWKLVNQLLNRGMVFLNQDKVVRLLQEEVRNRIEKRLEGSEIKNLPEAVTSIADKLTRLAQEKLGQEMEELPKVVVQTAYPPCINALFEAAKANHHLSHIERFTLTSFLVNVGMSPDNVNELFKTFSDYNERLTLYQIEHIAGERGSATRYTPPQCSLLQTHGVCKNRDDLCHQIYHPLAYYKRKQRLDSNSAA